MSASAAFAHLFEQLNMWWPEGDSSALREAANAWSETADLVDEIGSVLSAVAERLIDNYRGEAATAFQTMWSTWTTPLADGYLDVTSGDCRNLSAALLDFSSDVAVADRTLVQLVEQALAAAALNPQPTQPCGLSPEWTTWLQSASTQMSSHLVSRTVGRLSATGASIAEHNIRRSDVCSLPSAPGDPVDMGALVASNVSWPDPGSPQDLRTLSTSPVDFGGGQGDLSALASLLPAVVVPGLIGRPTPPPGSPVGGTTGGTTATGTGSGTTGTAVTGAPVTVPGAGGPGAGGPGAGGPGAGGPGAGGPGAGGAGGGTSNPATTAPMTQPQTGSTPGTVPASTALGTGPATALPTSTAAPVVGGFTVPIPAIAQPIASPASPPGAPPPPLSTTFPAAPGTPTPTTATGAVPSTPGAPGTDPLAPLSDEEFDRLLETELGLESTGPKAPHTPTNFGPDPSSVPSAASLLPPLPTFKPTPTSSFAMPSSLSALSLGGEPDTVPIVAPSESNDRSAMFIGAGAIGAAGAVGAVELGGVAGNAGKAKSSGSFPMVPLGGGSMTGGDDAKEPKRRARRHEAIPPPIV
jgi:hypothetical protein